MKIAVTVQGQSLDSRIEQSFDLCPFFLIWDTEKRQVLDILENPAIEMLEGGEEEAARMLVKSGAQAVLTDEIAPVAAEILTAAGVEIYEASADWARDAVAQFGEGDLPLSSASGAGLQGEVGTPPRNVIAEPEEGRGAGLGQYEKRETGSAAHYSCIACGERFEIGSQPPAGLRCEACGSKLIRKAP